jgi:hypothetical protein
LIRKIGVLFAVFAILASTTVPSVLACTTLTPGYWKTHLEAWPNPDIITVGSDTYDLSVVADRSALMGILWDRPRGDAWIILAQKVIAAQLSMYAYPAPGDWDWPGNFGGYDDGMVGLVEDANVLLAAQPAYRPRAPGRSDVIELANLIDYYLNYWDEHGL